MVCNWVNLLSFFLSHCSINIILIHAKTSKSIFSSLGKLPIPSLRAGYLKKDLSYRTEIFRTKSV